MTSYREASNNAKAARLGIIEQRTVGTRSRRDRPFVVEYRINPGSRMADAFKSSSWTNWGKWGAYRTEAEARRVIESQARKYPSYEFRMKPEAESQNQ